MRDWKILLNILIIGLLAPLNTWAAMSSTHYFIYADSVGYGGGLATSTSYNIESTIGGSPVGMVTGTTYTVKGGYQAMERGEISLTTDTDAVNLGTLRTYSAVLSTDSIVATIKTDSLNGYTLSINTVTGSGLTAVSDGVVDGDSDSEEYGVAVSGDDVAFADDQAIAASLILASATEEISTDRVLTLTFKAIVNAASTAASYSQTVNLAAMANL